MWVSSQTANAELTSRVNATATASW